VNWKFWKSNRVKNIVEKVLKNNMEDKFPCRSDNCLVRAACTKPCDKLMMDPKLLRDFVEENKCCPDCGSQEFYEGPCGGLSQNVKCAGCGHWFNFALPVFVERIHISKERFYE
jgi:hypothetical protein